MRWRLWIERASSRSVNRAARQADDAVNRPSEGAPARHTLRCMQAAAKHMAGPKSQEHTSTPLMKAASCSRSR